MDDDDKAKILKRIDFLTKFIRRMEDFSKTYNINHNDEKLYITACAQRKILRELIDNKFY